MERSAPRPPAPQQLALDLGLDPVAPAPAAKPPRVTILPPPEAPTVRIEHSGRPIDLPVEWIAAHRRCSMRFSRESRRVTLEVPISETLERAQSFAQSLAPRIAAWLQGDFAPRKDEERIEIEHQGRKLPLLLQRSTRARRIALRLKPSRREVILVVPAKASRKSALDFALANAGWIRERIDRMPAASPFVDGGEVPLRGVPHRIRHRADRRGAVWLEDGEIHVAGDVRHMARRVGEWLVEEAAREIGPRVRGKAARLAALGKGRTLAGVTIRDTVSRWGSCGADGSIMLSWRMILAPPFVLDYLVAHEVAHLAEQNHSRRFWQVCAQLADEPIEAAEAWLKQHGNHLLQYGRAESRDPA